VPVTAKPLPSSKNQTPGSTGATRLPVVHLSTGGQKVCGVFLKVLVGDLLATPTSGKAPTQSPAVGIRVRMLSGALSGVQDFFTTRTLTSAMGVSVLTAMKLRAMSSVSLTAARSRWCRCRACAERRSVKQLTNTHKAVAAF
jgi:hypothetical protein